MQTAAAPTNPSAPGTEGAAGSDRERARRLGGRRRHAWSLHGTSGARSSLRAPASRCYPSKHTRWPLRSVAGVRHAGGHARCTTRTTCAALPQPASHTRHGSSVSRTSRMTIDVARRPLVLGSIGRMQMLT
eukprot:4338807-Prymnesium_polylepis.2